MGQMVAAFTLSLYILNAAYGFDGSFARLDSFAFVSKTLAGSHVERGESGNRFVGTPLAGIRVPLPKQYLTGVDIQKAYFDRGLRSYLNGRWQDRGWWHYYVYGYLLKTPIGTLALLGIAFITALRCTSKRCSWSHGFCLIFPPLVILLLVSSQTGFSKNLRYAYPALPFIHILCGRVLCMNHQWLTRLAWVLVAVAAIESALVFPHSLSFFNAAIGSQNGHRYLLHSNVDFGQDLYLLKKYLDRDGGDFRVAYYGFTDPAMVGIEVDQPPSDRDPGWSGPRKVCNQRERPARAHLPRTQMAGWFASASSRTVYVLPEIQNRRLRRLLDRNLRPDRNGSQRSSWRTRVYSVGTQE